ncbi:MAG: TerB family tellurite resistance protein [Mariprofundaceae bacterium]
MLKFLNRRWNSGKKFSRREQGLELLIIKLVVNMMKIDDILDKRERNGIVRLVSKHFNIDIDATEELLMEIPHTEGDAPRFRQLAQQVKKNYTAQEVALLLGEVLSVAESGDYQNCYEKRYVNRISGLLGVSPGVLNAAKAHCKVA